jgi:hypothetical protein
MTSLTRMISQTRPRASSFIESWVMHNSAIVCRPTEVLLFYVLYYQPSKCLQEAHIFVARFSEFNTEDTEKSHRGH